MEKYSIMSWNDTVNFSKYSSVFEGSVAYSADNVSRSDTIFSQILIAPVSKSYENTLNLSKL